MKLRYILYWSILLIGFTRCGKHQEQKSKLTVLKISTVDSVFADSTTKQLVETVLSLPNVIRFSKLDLIQKKYGTIAIYFSQDSIAERIPPIYQNGNSLKLVHNIDTIDTAENPCYIFKKITISKNNAYVYMIFDITGAIAFGNLKYIDGKWSPDNEFFAGLR